MSVSFAERPLIGLTGGIACGKSAVSKLLAKQGAKIVDADRIAREVLSPHSEGLRQVVARWGETLVDELGKLDRAALGAIIFSAPEERRALEEITHPLIAAESARQVEDALAEGAPLVVYDAALLIEAGRADDFRPLVVVTTSASTQLARIMSRDGFSLEEARSRLDAQLPLAQKEALADHLIINDGTWEDLELSVDLLWKHLLLSV